jgi:hypothetical protein
LILISLVKRSEALKNKQTKTATQQKCQQTFELLAKQIEGAIGMSKFAGIEGIVCTWVLYLIIRWETNYVFVIGSRVKGSVRDI